MAEGEAEGAKVEGGLEEARYARAVVWMRGLGFDPTRETETEDMRRRRESRGRAPKGYEEGARQERTRDERRREVRKNAERRERERDREREARGLDGLDSPARCY